MAKPFLTAAWRNLLMANYVVDPSVLQKYLPFRTELDSFNGDHYVSLVAFMFQQVKVLGVSIPFHTNFEEINLRFYVRYKEDNTWKRGVAFIKEIVPKYMISFIANTLYGENYIALKTKHEWFEKDEQLHIKYGWKVGNNWNRLNCIAEKDAQPIIENSAEEFITEHYWGYTFMNANTSGVYEVVHPKWRVHAVHSFDIFCSVKELYGEAFESALHQTPKSIFLAEGSNIQVLKGSKIFG